MAPAPANSGSDAAISKSGIATSASGDRVIPASTRADGSQRREIRVRPGYRPPEDVEVYKNRTAEAFRNRGKPAGVPGAESLQEDESKTADNKSKNAKRREARKRAKAAADADEDTANAQPDGDATNGDLEVKSAEKAVPEAKPEENSRTEDEKKVKRLKKKLREARELQAKKEKGEGLLHEQFEKVIKINELLRELEKLGVQEEEPASNS